MLADLHIHSTRSDGTFTPAEIVAEAVGRGVGCIAVCDHNVIAGMREAEPVARAAGLRFIPGVEIDSIMMGMDAHILCYGADFSDPALSAAIIHARARLDRMSDDLLERMLPDYPMLDMDEYARSAHDIRRGGWKLLQYLCDKGVTKAMSEAYPLYDRYGVTYAAAGFAPAEEIISLIHAAGGCAVLAHPGVTCPENPLALVRHAVGLGIDGVKCCYPKHSSELTQALTALCDEAGLTVTAGSDCHGAFGRSAVGQTQTELSALRLRHPVFNNY